MIGRRVYLQPNYPEVDGPYTLWLAEGDYGRDRDGFWKARPPGHHAGSLENHEVIEHEDRTITVSPSILITGYDGNSETKWHGYLERGVWREV